jgi:multidrug transporter EmrE-like cation transporter
MKRDSGIWFRLMLIAFVTNGLGPFGLKVLNGWNLSSFQPQYLVWWYLGGAIFGALAFLSGSRHLQTREVAFGAAMAICSICGQTFTGLALSHGLPGHVVFPLTTGGSMFMVAAVGILFFKERVGGYGITGIVMGIVSLIMLSAA